MQKHSSTRSGNGRVRRAMGGLAGRFLRDARAGVAIPFALTAIPLTFMSVAAVDFHRASMVKNGLQDALDAATLAVGRSTLTAAADVQALGSSTLSANLRAYPNTHLDSTSFVLDGNSVEASAHVSVTPLVADAFGGGQLHVDASSEVVRAVNKLEVAMVLDNTGSMAGSKLTLLKTAAKNFIDTLSAAAARSADPNSVKIGVVPFSMTVNVGSTYQNASWMDTTGASPINDELFASHVNRFTLFQQMGVAWGGCVESRQAPYDVQDTAPSADTPATLFTPFFAPDEPDLQGYYNNYLADVTTGAWNVRQAYVAKYNTQTFSHTGTNGSTGYQLGPNAGCSLQALARLSTNWTSLKSTVDGMNAVGDTNIPMGMMWGWHVLSPNAPFADGVPYGTAKTTKVMVLMTDGQNQNTSNNDGNASFYSGDGYIWQNRLGISSGSNAQRTTALDGRETAVCTNMKNQGIVVYTVRVDVNDNNYTVLQGCASSPDKFYDVQDATQLSAVFNAIAGAIENLRISK